MIQSWGLPNRTRGKLIWIASPNFDKTNTARINVFYQLDDGSCEHAWLMWSQLPYLHLGYIYKNGKPPEPTRYDISGRLDPDDIKKSHEEACVKIDPELILFSNFKSANGISTAQRDKYFKDALHEKCLVIKRPDTVIYMPCIVALQGLFGAYRGTINPIIHEREFDTYFESDFINSSQLMVTLSPRTPFELRNDDALRYALWIRHKSSVYNEYNKTAQDIRLNKKVMTRFPEDFPYSIRYFGIQIETKGLKRILVQKIQIENIFLPYKTIYVMMLSSVPDDTAAQGSVPRRRLSEDIINDTSTLAGSDTGTMNEHDYCPYTFRKDYTICKVKNEKALGKSVGRYVTEDENAERYTTNESGYGFSAKPVGIQYRPEVSENNAIFSINKDLQFIEGLNDFYSALNQLLKDPNIQGMNILCGEFSGIKSCCLNDKGLARKWVLADICMTSGDHAHIFEIQKRLSEISTLIILRPEKEPQFIAEQAVAIITMRNGNYRVDDLEECYNKNYILLSHRKERTTGRWADLLGEKILS